MNQTLVAKIRKLLKLARTNTPEAPLAQVRAKEIMRKYNLVVTLDDFVRRVMPNASGVIWKEQLLFVLASKHHCRVLSSTDGGQVVLAGESVYVDQVVDLYAKALIRVGLACETEWRSFFDTDLEKQSDTFYIDEDEDYDDDEDHDIRHPAVVSAFYRFYFESMVNTLVQKQTPKQDKPRERPMSDVATPKREAPSKVDWGKKETNAALKRLTELIGYSKAQALWARSRQGGQRSAEIVETDFVGNVPRLAAAVPVEPTRFRLLEVD